MAVNFIEHTADIRMAVEAKDMKELFSEAARGMARYIFEPDSWPQKTTSRELDVQGIDHEDLLINWLSKLLYISAAESLMPISINILELSGETLIVSADFGSAEPKHEIKAVTHHGLAIKKTNGALKAAITFDV